MNGWLVLGLSLVMFVAAAKTHGRQLRTERQLAGHASVTFGAANHPWVEALWRRDRWIFWSTAALFAVAAAIVSASVGFSPSWAVTLLLWSATAGFLAAGLRSLASLFSASRLEQPPVPSALLWGSAAWWSLTLVLIGIVAALSARRLR
jgi:hypothetical protein